MRVVTTILLAGAVSTAAAQPSPGQAEHEVLEAHRQYLEALANCDVKMADRLRHSEWTNVAPSGRVSTTADLKQLPECKPSKPATVEELRVRIFGSDTAVLTGRITIFPRDRAPMPEARFTSVWAKGTDGAWRQVAYQATEIRQQQPTR